MATDSAGGAAAGVAMGGEAVTVTTYFTVTTPRSWFELELRPDRRDTAIRDLVGARVRETPELWRYRGEIVRTLRRYARNAWQSGARYAGAFVTPAEDTTVTGCLTVTAVPPPPGAGDASERVIERLIATSTGPRRSGDEATWSSVVVVDIPRLGRCPRSYGVEDVRLPDDTGVVRVVTMQTFVRAPDGGMLLVSASSPDLDLAEELFELFDAVTATIRVGQAPAAVPAPAEATP
ncbi:MAG: hypothetical protein QM635_02225 [Microbacteriaceae bacterium]